MIMVPYKKIIIVGRILLGIIVLLALGNFAYVNRMYYYDNQYITHARDLRLLSQMIAKNVEELLIYENAYLFLAPKKDDFNYHLRILKNGIETTTEYLPPSPQAIREHELKELVDLWDVMQTKLNFILKNKDIILSIKNINLLGDPRSNDMASFKDNQNIIKEFLRDSQYFYYSSFDALKKSEALVNAYINYSSNRLVTPTTGTLLSMFAVIILMIVLYCAFKENKFAVALTQERSRTTHEEIQRLVNEISGLAEGNLAIQATIGNGVTGAIAYSINYALDELRQLVFKINQTTEKVSEAALHTQARARDLAIASDKQTQEIVSSVTSINAMASSIEQVSQSAAQSSEVAQESVSIALAGGQVVQNTIQSMDKILSQIQSTEKRVKRLGESSQEIGEILSLIEDIAEQTNVLALNAAIQAAMAGDAGRGFAVVADEVQRLAERSSRATKEVEILVKTIQADTGNVVDSMEQTISEVSQGSKLAQDAGVALERIENVSRKLANIIHNISDASKTQADVSSKVSNMMGLIENIAKDTASGTVATADSIGELADLVKDLRTSVEGFKLPEDFHETS